MNGVLVLVSRSSILKNVLKTRSVIRCQVKCAHRDNTKELSYTEKESWLMSRASRTVCVFSNKFSRYWLPDMLAQCGTITDITEYPRQHSSLPFYLVEFEKPQFAKLWNHKYLRSNDQQARHFVFAVPGQGSHARKHPRVPDSVIQRAHMQQFRLVDLAKAENISQQIEAIYQGLAMTDSDVRLRYFVVSCLESIMKQVFPSCSIQAFGSSSTGFGKYDGDLDMTINVDIRYKEGNLAGELMTPRDVLRRVYPMLRQRRQFHVHESVFHNVRIPILKFQHKPSNLPCDISAQNQSGFRMSELLHWLASCSPTVYPLVFAVRLWARINGIASPGGKSPKLTNFQLTLLVLHFLQASSVLPLLSHVCDQDFTDMDFPIVLPAAPSGDKSAALDELLLQFFHFYATADFNLGICIKNGIVDRTDTRPIFVENPVELDRNAAKTVEKNMLDKFQDCCRDSHAKLEKEIALGRYSTSDWGVLRILRKRTDEKELARVKR